MAEKSKLVAETEAYLAKIRKTISDSRSLVESARLRMAETDRMLEGQGLTREQVMEFSFTDEQKKAVNAQLASRGLPLLDETDDDKVEYSARGGSDSATESESFKSPASEASANFTAGDGDGTVENRKRKFNVMMQQFRM